MKIIDEYGYFDKRDELEARSESLQQLSEDLMKEAQETKEQLSELIAMLPNCIGKLICMRIVMTYS